MFKLRKGTCQDAEAIAKVQVDSWQTTYRGIVADEFIDSLSYEGQQRKWNQLQDDAILYVIENLAGDVVGFANGGTQRNETFADYDGELYAIYLLQAYQGQGGGRLLFETVKKDLLASGYQKMSVLVLKGNPAVQFYQAMGGRLLGEEVLQILGEDYVEFVYGWDLFKCGEDAALVMDKANADFVAIDRSLVMDPDWVEKVREGQEETSDSID